MRRVGTRARAAVVVPTFNEAPNLPDLVRRVCEALPDVEIVVVDDASPDGTADVAESLAVEFPVRVIRREGERSLSSAVLRGLSESRAEICVVMDADLGHPPGTIPELVKAVEGGADLAIGSRYASGGAIDEWPWHRRLASKAGTLLARPLTGVRDPLSGFFCLRAKLLEGVKLRPRGFKILLEILARAHPARVVEVPIRFEDRGAGRSKFGPRERREYLAQIWTLYRDLNAWPWCVAKFLVTGFLGYLVHMAVMAGVVKFLGGRPNIEGAIAGFTVAMTSNYLINRRWTFRARHVGVTSSYLKYASSAVAGLGIQIGVMTLLRAYPWAWAATLGIIAGTVCNFLLSYLWTFPKRTT